MLHGSRTLLVALMVLTLFTIGAAANSHTEVFVVTAKVNPYIEFSCRTNTVAVDTFTGVAYEQQAITTSCEMTQNTDVDMTVEFEPLSHDVDGTEIGTAVMLMRGLAGKPVEQELGLIAGPWSTEEGGAPMIDGDYSNWEFAKSGVMNVSGPREAYRYVLWIEGKLGEIADQPAGDYSTEIVLTMSY